MSFYIRFWAFTISSNNENEKKKIHKERKREKKNRKLQPTRKKRNKWFESKFKQVINYKNCNFISFLISKTKKCYKLY